MPTLAIRAITPLAHNVFQYDLDKPGDYNFKPGQATDVSIAKDGWRTKKRPFTFTSLPDDDHLQFTIKSYPDHDDVTQELSRLLVGDELEIEDPWGTIEYKGPGTFIAGGAGLTPFLAIFRAMQKDRPDEQSTLYFANKRVHDIFLDNELSALMGIKVHHILSQEQKDGYMHGRIDQQFLADNVGDFGQKFYVCGPDAMVKDITDALKALGADPDGLVFEQD